MRVVAVAAALVVSMLFPLPMPVAVADRAPTTAAQAYGWGAPTRAEDFTGDLSGWTSTTAPATTTTAGARRRRSRSRTASSRSAATPRATPRAWPGGQARRTAGGRPGCGRRSGDPDYHAVLLLWPDNEDEGGYGGEIDFMENSDPTRQSTEMFVHYGNEDNKLNGAVTVDATQWHNWAVEWSPDHITAFLDGKEWWSTAKAATQPPGPMHMTVQLDLFRNPGGLKPSTMQVDWVRYYPITGSGPSPTPTRGGTEGPHGRCGAHHPGVGACPRGRRTARLGGHGRRRRSPPPSRSCPPPRRRARRPRHGRSRPRRRP